MDSHKLPIIERKGHLAPKVVIVDGQSGCGKTMLSPIIGALKRVELLTYAYEIEHICALYFLEKIELDAAVALIRMWTDLRLYNTLMSREVNFRLSDLSSVFSDAQPLKYIKRIFQKGDELVVQRIQQEQPILNLTTHNLLGISEPVVAALGSRAVILEVVRHPLYMVKQQALNIERIISTPRHFTVYLKYKEKNLPFWTYGWEEEFIQANNVEKVIYAIYKIMRLTEQKKERLIKNCNAQILTIPFEQFVLSPWEYLEKIAKLLGTEVTNLTRSMMKKQRVPRKRYGQGLGLKIYKRCGWEPPKANTNEADELTLRRDFIKERVSLKALSLIDDLSDNYQRSYLKSVI